MLTLCEELDLASINRIPLLMGLLSGRYTPERLPPDDDVRSLFFSHSRFVEDLERLNRVKAVLTRCNRTLAQGALAWILSRSRITVPIPGFRSVAQVEDNVGTLTVEPFSPEEMNEIQAMLEQSMAN